MMPRLRLAASTTLLALAGATGSTLLSGCVVKEQVVVRPAAAPVVRHMPAPIAEDRGAMPGPDWHWVPGHWKWEGRDWAWAHGHWVHQPVQVMPAIIVEQITVAPSPAHYWVPGHWVWQLNSGGWVWVKGAWHV
jgi:hypothetical protein